MNQNSLKDSVTRVADLYDLTEVTEIRESKFVAKSVYPNDQTGDLSADIEFVLYNDKVGVKVIGSKAHVSKYYYLGAREKFTIYELILLATSSSISEFHDYVINASAEKVA